LQKTAISGLLLILLRFPTVFCRRRWKRIKKRFLKKQLMQYDGNSFLLPVVTVDDGDMTG